MARTRTAPEAEAAQDETSREDEAAAVEEQNVEAAAAEEKRRAAMEKAASVKSYPDEAAPPTEKVINGETAYSHERLLESSEALAGVEPHVMAGALHGVSDAFLSRAAAQKLAQDWLAQPDSSNPPVEG